jgi:hypothetical protein
MQPVVSREAGRPEREPCPADEKAAKIRQRHIRNNHSTSASPHSFQSREIPQETKTKWMQYASNSARRIDSSSYVALRMNIAVPGLGK